MFSECVFDSKDRTNLHWGHDDYITVEHTKNPELKIAYS